MPVESFPIETENRGRLIVTHTTKGAHSWSLDEALDLLVALTSALERAADDTPLPAAEPPLPPPPPTRPTKLTRHLLPSTPIEDLL